MRGAMAASRKGDEVTQDALYAMRYDPDGLAQGAYDARLERYGSKRLARSPAIDAGSDDAWGYDTTSTNPKVIDLGQPDIGYHYYRRVADDDPVNDQLIEFTFRQPKVNGSGAIAKYVVLDPVNQYADLHEILPEDQYYDGTTNVKQEGFSGKDVVLGRLEGYAITEGNYNLELKTETGGKTPQRSSSASISLIIEPD